jgi:hypothetical protein
MLSEDERKRFIDSVLSRKGCYYCWPHKSNGYSGKDLPSAKFPRTYDCSGLVTASLFEVGICDWRATYNAQRLADNSNFIDRVDMKPGDLVFYGADGSRISHVMVYLGRYHQNAPIFGASGGWSKTLTPEIAEKQGAKVRGYKTIDYRQDFVACGRLVIRKEVQNAEVR